MTTRPAATYLLRSLVDIQQALGIVIHDAWTGYAAHSPTLAAYTLARTAQGGFEGQARFNTALTAARTASISLSAKVAQGFFAQLSAAALAAQPIMRGQFLTDHHPRFEIVIHLSERSIMLFSNSQAPNRAPWRVFVQGELRWANDGTIGRAVQALARPLKRHVLDEMMVSPLHAPRAPPRRRR